MLSQQLNTCSCASWGGHSRVFDSQETRCQQDPGKPNFSIFGNGAVTLSRDTYILF